MTKEESEKKYNELCTAYGKSASTGEFRVFDSQVAKLKLDQYDMILKIVKTYLNDFKSIPYPSHFEKAIK